VRPNIVCAGAGEVAGADAGAAAPDEPAKPGESAIDRAMEDLRFKSYGSCPGRFLSLRILSRRILSQRISSQRILARRITTRDVASHRDQVVSRDGKRADEIIVTIRIEIDYESFVAAAM
jgi:hypothetical protein